MPEEAALEDEAGLEGQGDDSAGIVAHFRAALERQAEHLFQNFAAPGVSGGGVKDSASLISEKVGRPELHWAGSVTKSQVRTWVG